jgi:PKD repeat protein
VAQPKVGSSPLWVWFTDMSIAGANWSWDFGDNLLVIWRSPYYSFTAPGNYQVTQWISGPSNYSQTIIVGYPSTLKGKCVPAMLHVLLLAD